MRKLHSTRGRWPMAVAAIAGSVMLAAPPAPAAAVAGWTSGLEARTPDGTAGTYGTYASCSTSTNPAGFNAKASLDYPDPGAPNGVLRAVYGANSYEGPVTVSWHVPVNWDNPDGTTSDPRSGSCQVGYHWAVTSGSINGTVDGAGKSISCADAALVDGTSGLVGSDSLYSRPPAASGGGERIVLKFSSCTLNGASTNGPLTFELFDATHVVCTYGDKGPTQCVGNYVITQV